MGLCLGSYWLAVQSKLLIKRLHVLLAVMMSSVPWHLALQASSAVLRETRQVCGKQANTQTLSLAVGLLLGTYKKPECQMAKPTAYSMANCTQHGKLHTAQRITWPEPKPVPGQQVKLDYLVPALLHESHDLSRRGA